MLKARIHGFHAIRTMLKARIHGFHATRTVLKARIHGFHATRMMLKARIHGFYGRRDHVNGPRTCRYAIESAMNPPTAIVTFSRIAIEVKPAVKFLPSTITMASLHHV